MRRDEPGLSDERETALALAAALRDGALELHYQPKLDLRSRRVTGVEALARWPGSGIGPQDFIPGAERAGLIDALTEWACRTALAQVRRWREEGLTLSVAINVSALSLGDVAFPDLLQHLCEVEGVPPDQVTVELTESATQHVVQLLDTLTRFRLKGMAVALDDFGTGYSSLLQLRHLPFTELKIDQIFVRDAATAEDSRLIVKSVIDLAHALGLTAVAEGVEDEETLRVLAALGCDLVQGFLIARPMTAAAVTDWMAGAPSLQRLFLTASGGSATESAVTGAPESDS